MEIKIRAFLNKSLNSIWLTNASLSTVFELFIRSHHDFADVMYNQSVSSEYRLWIFDKFNNGLDSDISHARPHSLGDHLYEQLLFFKTGYITELSNCVVTRKPGCF